MNSKNKMSIILTFRGDCGLFRTAVGLWVASAVSTISFSFCLYPDLCPACPCPCHCHDLCPDPACPANCADDHDRVLYPGRDLDPSDLCRDPADRLCPGDRDREIVNENASDACSSYKREVLQLRRSVRNVRNVERNACGKSFIGISTMETQDIPTRYTRGKNFDFKCQMTDLSAHAAYV